MLNTNNMMYSRCQQHVDAQIEDRMLKQVWYGLETKVWNVLYLPIFKGIESQLVEQFSNDK